MFQADDEECPGLSEIRHSIPSVNSRNSVLQSVTASPGSTEIRQKLTMRDSIEIETPAQPHGTASRVQASHSEEGPLLNCHVIRNTLANRMHASTDKVLSNIVLRSMGDTTGGRASLLNFLSASKNSKGFFVVMPSSTALWNFLRII